MKKRTPRGEKQHPSEPIVSAKSSKADRVDGVCVGEEPLPGMKLRAICRGHTGSIGRISWSPCGDFIASPSDDKTIRIWSRRQDAQPEPEAPVTPPEIIPSPAPDTIVKFDEKNIPVR